MLDVIQGHDVLVMEYYYHITVELLLHMHYVHTYIINSERPFGGRLAPWNVQCLLVNNIDGS